MAACVNGFCEAECDLGSCEVGADCIIFGLNTCENGCCVP
jgi:hypothetical protein